MATPATAAYGRYDRGEGAFRELVMEHLPLVRFIAGRARAARPPGGGADDQTYRVSSLRHTARTGRRSVATTEIAARWLEAGGE